jgi:anti-sigma factor RsiW
MRHIPEDELHAYLDQGLSRTQCVEIESHLAACPSCQATRDGIAALRDRTTALLSRLAPPRGFSPAFEVLRERAAVAADQRRRRLQLAAWAASLIVAVGLGWGASSIASSNKGSAASPASVAAVPAPAPAGTAVAPGRAADRDDTPVRSAAVRKPVSDTSEPRRPTRPPVRLAAAARDSADSVADRRAAALSVLDPTPALELTRLEPPAGRTEIELGGMWRTMSWDGAKAEAGERVPHIDGLPVVQVQVQNGEQGARPVMVVAQQLSSGQVIRTIEGPATDVSQLLSRRSMAAVDSLVLPGDTAGSRGDGDHAMAMQVGDRMLAITGNLPSDSLRAMIRRLNAEMRTK